MSQTHSTTTVTQERLSGVILVAPHQFPGLEREKRLAEEFGIELVAARDVQEFRARIPEAAVILLTPYAKIEARDFEAMRHCRAVVRYGIGYDNVDVDAARRARVPVSIVPGASSLEVASHALAMGIALVRRIPQGQNAIASGGWAGNLAFDAPKLDELRVAVIGMGRIGRQVALWYRALGADVRVYDPFIEVSDFPAAPLDELLVTSDIVSLHVPLSKDTASLISADVLTRMPRGAVIVNVSRGGLIDESALAEALRTGRIAGAGLDTFGQEPLPSEHPLRSAPNLILTPHMAWRSNRALDALQNGVIERARKALLGEPLLDVVT
ncbi:C-terminal binding protein [Micromonospora sp. NPDC048830]|uniref:C-terminal binding protein n=1 Tax=Micromonospora sp. NPDC048830 TaxID=3364257 RepID=UPI0037114A21